MNKNIFKVAVIIFFTPCSVYAYLDPGTGSYIIQIGAAFFLSSLFFVKVYFQKIKYFMQSKFLKGKKIKNGTEKEIGYSKK